MAKLADFVEIAENNMECVVLKIKHRSRMGLIGLGCFSGNEEMIRLTKGDTQTCTVFYGNGTTFSWEWGRNGHTLVSDKTSRCGRMVQECLEDDFGICMTGSKEAIRATSHIRRSEDGRGMEETYKLMWFRDTEVCIHRNGSYLRHMNGIDKALNYVRDRLDVTSEIRTKASTGCAVLTINGRRK